MQKCIKCGKVDGIIKAGFLRGQQRFLCKECNHHFVLETNEVDETKGNNSTTIIDVAKHLGVSISTVSRALNNKSDINQKTKDIILQTAIELDYKPNFLAQSLHKGRTNTIGVIIPDVEHPFFAKVLAGIQQVANNTGYNIIVCHSNEKEKIEAINIETLIACRVDGLLISSSIETINFEHLKNINKKGIPIVQYDRVCAELNTSKVMHQDFKGSFELVEHLIAQGYNKIGIMVGPESLLISKTRLEGYISALIKYEIEFNPNYVYYSHKVKDDADNVLNYFLNLENPPQAIYSIFYRSAIDMMIEAKKRNIKVPEELSFVGYGDDILAEYVVPSLTVFNNYPAKIGETAIRMLIEQIEFKENYIPYTKNIEGKLIIRQSSLRQI